VTSFSPVVAAAPPERASEPEVALELRDLAKSFGSVVAVNGVSLAVRRGEFVTLLGPSGSGKTTILRIVAGFEQPTAGAGLLEGTDIADRSPAERGIGVVFQHYALFPHMTVAENVRYPLKLRRWNRSRAAERVREALALVRLEHVGDRSPKELSGGQQQRIALARALAFHPRLLLMDEPLGALDRALRLEMEEEIRRIHRESGATVVYVTHDQEEALTLSDRIGIMRDGRLLQAGAPEQLFDRPIDEFVATFFGDCTLIPVDDATEAGDGPARASVLGQEHVLRTSAPLRSSAAQVAVRPTRFRLTPGPGDVHVPAEVVDVLYLGETSRVLCHHDTVGEVLVRTEPRLARGLTPGGRLTLAFRPDDAVLVPA
jgi:putative spermidine/putrescine transport system ATP-binding protein